MKQEHWDQIRALYDHPYSSSDLRYFASQIVDDLDKWLEENNLEIREKVKND